MPKKRVDLTEKERDAVLKEFNYHCAICGKERPQIHHIDEDPSNNERLNLIPLCPNCHLIDQHNPTVPLDQGVLQLFRAFKDPTILKPQFQPLYRRVSALSNIDGLEIEIIENRAIELIDFVASLEMGNFYSKQISVISKRKKYGGAIWDEETPQIKHQREEISRQHEKGYREQIQTSYPQIVSLVVEMLRFQKW